MSNNTGRPLSIAVSGKSGCATTTTSALFAHRLGIQLVNYTFRNLAVDEGLEFEELRKLAEADDKWDKLVDTRQAQMANAHPSVRATGRRMSRGRSARHSHNHNRCCVRGARPGTRVPAPGGDFWTLL